MKLTVFHPEDSSKCGVALIIVLGFLSIMIIMALAFLTQARTERLVSNATLEAQRGRQLVRTALSAAMNDYSVELWGEGYLLPPTNTPAGDDLTVFTSFPPTAETDAGQTLEQSRVRLMAGEARQWIPRGYMKPAVSNLVGKAEWILVREDPTSQSPILGRYAYVCFDMSGGIDANLIAQPSAVTTVGNPTNRPSVRAVGMGELPETASASAFKTLRNGWRGFDNLSELILLTNGKYNGGEGSVARTINGVKYTYSDEADPDIEDETWPPISDPRWKGDKIEWSAALISSKVSDLVPYSLAAYRGTYDIAKDKWIPPVLCDNTANWTDVLGPVQAQLASVPDTVKAIDDYLDADSDPQGGIPNYPSSEAVPMFNELGMTLQIDYNTTNIMLSVDLEFETWFPFPSTNNPAGDPFSIQAPTIACDFNQPVGADIWLRCALLNNGQDYVVPIQASATVAELNMTSDFAGGLPQSQGSFHYDIPLVQQSTNSLTTTTRLLVQFMKSDQPLLLRAGPGPAGAIVDQMEFDSGTLGLNMQDGVPYQAFIEVDDPRLNHDLSRWNQALALGGSMNQVNGNAQTVNPPGYGVAGGAGLYMYCRNGPMESPAELGYISSGNPWETIDLCTDAGAEMMAGLVSDPAILAAVQSASNNFTYYTNGTINPSTSSTNVLRAAFTGLLRKEVPEMPDMPGPDDGPLHADDAQLLAANMVFESASKAIEPTGGAFMSGSAWARVPAMQIGGALAGGAGGLPLPSGMAPLNKNQRESLIRNTWGLFSPNNSMFTVIVIGQAIKEGAGKKGDLNLASGEDMITGERRGVALVWRDPIPSTGGSQHHEMFVRMFKFLDE